MNRYILGLAGIVLVGAHAMAQSDGTRNFEWKQCDEDVLGIRVDPAPLLPVVGPEFELVLEDGRAQVAIMIQDCLQYWIDGENLGANQMVHVLARIQGPADSRAVVGAEHTEATFTWFSVFAGSSNPRDRQARMASRTAPSGIGGVSLDPPAWPRGGNASLHEGLRVKWHVAAAEESSLLMGVNHDVYLRDESGDIILKRIQAIGNLIAAPAPGILEVEGDTAIAGLVGPGSHPARVYSFFPIWARGTLGEAIAR